MRLPIRLPGPTSPSWVIAESGGAALFSLGTMLVIGRVIGPEATGVGTVAVAAFLLLDVFGASLFTDALVQRPRLTPRHESSAATAAVLVGLCGAVLLAASGGLLAASSGIGQLGSLTLALAPLLPLSAYAGAVAGLVLRQQRFRLLALRVLIGQPTALVAGLVVAQAGGGAWAMVVNQMVLSAIVFLLIALLGGFRLRPRLDLGALRELWPVAGPQIAAMTVAVGKYRIFLLTLGLIVSEAVLGVVHFAFRMLDAVLVMVWQSVSRLAMPRLCALQGDRKALADCYGELAQMQALLGLPVAVGAALVAPDLVGALLGPAWAGTAEAVRVGGLAAAVAFLAGDHVSLFVAIGRARWNAWVAFISLALPLAALLLAAPQTPAGVALAWATQSLLISPVLAWVVLREIRRSPFWLLRQVAPAILACAAMAAAVLAVQAVVPEGRHFLRLFAGVGAGAAAYAAVAWVALGGRLPAALARPAGTPAE